MFRCNYCTRFAVFECFENKFCLNHRPQHDMTHSGTHKLNDVYIRLSKQEKVEFDKKINWRLKTLKECKNMLADATAKYIKDIQELLSQKFAEIDKIAKIYINLITKCEFDETDVDDIENIFSTRLKLKQLNHFSSSEFKNYVNQEILQLTEFSIGELGCEERIRLLSSEGKFLIDVLACCKPKNIPEHMIKGIIDSSMGEISWCKARDEIIKFSVVNIDEKLKLWSIHDSFINLIEKKRISLEANTACFNYCSINFVIDEEINLNPTAEIKMKEMLTHIDKIIENSEILKIDVNTITLNLAKAYAYLEYDQDNLKNCINILRKNLNFTENYKLLLEIGQLYMSINKYKKAEKFYLKCLKIQQQTLPENRRKQANLYNKLADLYEKLVDYEKAENFYLQCLNIVKQILDYPNRATLYNNLGNFYSKKADYKKAEKFSIKSLKMCEHTLPENHFFRAKHLQYSWCYLL